MKKLLIACVAVLGLGLAACNDANVASSNLSTAADNFEINRRVVFYNGITGEYMLSIEGLCSIGNASTGKNAMYVICKLGHNKFKKHFLGLSDNVTFFVEHLEPAPASTQHYRVTFKPSVIIPDIEVR
jgi:predicted small secreted protein